MRNTYVIAAVVALGLVAPVAFYAGQYVSQNDERVAGTSLNQGDGGNGLTGLPGGDGPSMSSFSFGGSQPANTYGGINVRGRLDKLGDLETPDDRVEEVELQDHKDWIMIETYVVPDDWDGTASGKRIHSPLAPEGEPGVTKQYDKSSPLLYLAVSHGGYKEEADTRAVDMYMKIESIIEPDLTTAVSDLDELDPSIGGRIWVNFSLNYAKIELKASTQSSYGAYIELPKSWIAPSVLKDKATPKLFFAMGANAGVADVDAEISYELDVTMVYESDVRINVEQYTHMEDVSFTYGHSEDAGLTYVHMENVSFTFVHLEDVSFTYSQVKEGGWNQTESKKE